MNQPSFDVKLLSVKRDPSPEGRRIVATYKVSHAGPKTTLALDVVVTIDEDSREAKASIEVEAPSQKSVAEALAILGDWLRRCGAALEGASESVSIIPVKMGKR